MNGEVKETGAAEAQSSPKAGVLTSEFGVTLASSIALVAGMVPSQYAGSVEKLVIAYVICRTVLKVIHSLDYGQRLGDLPSVPEIVQTLRGVER